MTKFLVRKQGIYVRKNAHLRQRSLTLSTVVQKKEKYVVKKEVEN